MKFFTFLLVIICAKFVVKKEIFLLTSTDELLGLPVCKGENEVPTF
jgi:hypothetical protein